MTATQDRSGLTFSALDQKALEQLACDCAIAAQPDDCFALYGDLGAGKSTFARAFIRQRAGDHDQQLEVPSPTFTLVQTYELSPTVHHYDLYRLASADDVDDLGFTESLEGTITLVEWPDRAGDILRSDTLSVAIEECGDADMRSVTISGPDDAMQRLGRSLRIRALLDENNWPNAQRRALNADASARGYELIKRNGGLRVLMDAPRTPDGPPVQDGKPYSQIAHLAEDVTAFVAIGQLLEEAGFRAPHIDAFDLDEGLVLLEHLGTGSVLDAQGKPIAQHYCDAARCLAHMHQQQWPSTVEVSPGRVHTISQLDLDAFQIEASLLLDWYVPRMAGKQPDEKARQHYRQIIADLHAALDHRYPTLIMRDFHSPNIMWCEGDTPVARTGLIDFQDALLGPAAYDVISLADDARVDIEPSLRTDIIAAYCDERRKLNSAFDGARFEKDAAILSAQRAAKILGIFVRLDERDGKPAYLAHLPRVQKTLQNALAHPALAALAGWLDEQGVFGHD